jgi:hypothetical protein
MVKVLVPKVISLSVPKQAGCWPAGCSPADREVHLA